MDQLTNSEYVYTIKDDDKGIRLAGSAEDSLASNVGNYPI